MPVQDILVHVDRTHATEARLNYAVALAKAYDAHLTALYVSPKLETAHLTTVDFPAELMAKQASKHNERASAVKAQCEEKANNAGISLNWVEAVGAMDKTIMAYAAACDYLILGQAAEDDPNYHLSQDPDQMILSCGRPTLIVPSVSVKMEPPKKAVVAWNGSAEAVRALNDALPLLQQSDVVEILRIDPDASTKWNAADFDNLIAHLARHGVNAQASRTVSGKLHTTDVLLNHISDSNADLLIMGAYGHSRLRELVFGGVTRNILRSMTIPVLMSSN